MFALLRVASSTPPNLSALTFHSAQTAWQSVHCARGKLKAISARFNLRHTNTNANGDGCLLLGVLGGLEAVRPRQSASVLAGLLTSQPVATHNNPSRRSKPAMASTTTLHGSVDHGGPRTTAALSLCFAHCNQRVDAKRKPFQVTILWYLTLPL